ncbi:MAG: hypothetical protein H6600_00345 [Flavobacteriales bacterium]|nr:hypothetical protein [Flavobacteriales bacterium]MCB9196883.1 hypothetical protein [Flavobacteriales bacterium]
MTAKKKDTSTHITRKNKYLREYDASNTAIDYFETFFEIRHLGIDTNTEIPYSSISFFQPFELMDEKELENARYWIFFKLGLILMIPFLILDAVFLYIKGDLTWQNFSILGIFIALVISGINSGILSKSNKIINYTDRFIKINPSIFGIEIGLKNEQRIRFNFNDTKGRDEFLDKMIERTKLSN